MFTHKFSGLMGWIAIIAMVVGMVYVQAGGEPLPRGESVIEVPAVGEGLCVHPLFQSNMVLQRGKPIAIWGWAAPGQTVTVSFDGQEQSATAAADRTWKVTFAALDASDQPRKMTIKDESRTITLDNILIGDVWLCGGQSNMEFPITNAFGGDLAVVSANFSNVRLLTIPQVVSQTPINSFPRLQEWSSWDSSHHRKGYWDVCTPQTVREFSCIGYIFARRLYMATGVPIGMIDVSRGGTNLETWTPIEVLRSMKTPQVGEVLAKWDTSIKEWSPKADLEQRIAHFNARKKAGKTSPDAKPPTEPGPGPALDMNRPGNSYGGMIGPMIGLQVKGAIWHQGYTNAVTESTRGGEFYQQVFPRMIEAWRKAFDNPDMAFGIISLCTDQPPQTLANFLHGLVDNGCYIREAQFKTFMAMRQAGDKNIGYASSYDQRQNWFHPQFKIPVGERIARWALATQYGAKIRWQPPMIQQMKIEDGKIVLQLDSDVNPAHDEEILGFAIAGADKKFYPADAQYPMENGRATSRKEIILSSPFVATPVAYRYAWSRNPLGNLLAGHSELPIPISRSDDWSISDLYEAYMGKPGQSPTALDRNERRMFDQALQAADLERRVQEAKAFVKEQEAQQKK